MNLTTFKFYCLPDDYEIIDSSLDDIKYVIRPTFKAEEIAKLDKATTESHDLAGKPYLPGFIGMNNIKANDYLNVVVQALAHVPRFRDFFMDDDNYAEHKTPLLTAFGDCVRKIWSPRLFKGQMSPHELIQVYLLFYSLVGLSTTKSGRVDCVQQKVHLVRPIGPARFHLVAPEPDAPRPWRIDQDKHVHDCVRIIRYFVFCFCLTSIA